MFQTKKKNSEVNLLFVEFVKHVIIRDLNATAQPFSHQPATEKSEELRFV